MVRTAHDRLFADVPSAGNAVTSGAADIAPLLIGNFFPLVCCTRRSFLDLVYAAFIFRRSRRIVVTIDSPRRTDFMLDGGMAIASGIVGERHCGCRRSPHKYRECDETENNDEIFYRKLMHSGLQ